MARPAALPPFLLLLPTSPPLPSPPLRYGVNCGVKVNKDDAFGLLAWESSGWMAEQDPYVERALLLLLVYARPASLL